MMKEIIKGYVLDVKDNKKDDEDICFWVMGHSMGGGVANIIAYNLINDKEINGRDDNVYCYTFATPNTFYEYDTYEEDDFVPKLPIIRKFFYKIFLHHLQK